MKAVPSFLSFCVTVAALGVMGPVMSAVSGSPSVAWAQTAPPNPPPPLPPFEQKLRAKPKALWVMEAQGVKLYASELLRVFIVNGPLVDNSGVDAQGLYEKAKRCMAGQGCGVKLTQAQANNLYASLERAQWYEAKLDHRLAAISYGGATLVFTDAGGSMTTAVANIFARGGLCLPFGSIGAQPQCPPGPIPPRDEWLLNVVMRGIQLP